MSAEKKVPINPVHEKDVAMSITVLMRAYYSTYHLWSARHFASIAASVEARPGKRPRFDIEHRAFVTGCLLSSVSFLEAAVNELYQDAADEHMSYLEPLDPRALSALAGSWNQGADRHTILQKYQLACHLTRRDPFEPGEEPFKSAALLIRLRNELVHYVPKTRIVSH